jgi:3-hydroxybutyryl-CoA dehydrogenase
MKPNKVGVVGIGVIGAGVVQALAEAGFDVLAVDRDDERVHQAKRAVTRQLRMMRLLGKRGGASPEDLLRRVSWASDLEALGEADFVIENVPEVVDLKRSVLARLDRICGPEVVFALNTSCIPITRLAAATLRPAQVLGIHFMNPVPLKDTVEVVRGFHTSPQTVEVAGALLGAMGKEYVVVNDAPGFVSNRVLMLTINEAIQVLQDGVASHEEIDRIFTACFGHKMGPLRTADLIGLDTILLSIQVLYDDYADGKYRPAPLLRKMVDAGHLGQKSGRGFYAYSPAAGAVTRIEPEGIRA